MLYIDDQHIYIINIWIGLMQDYGSRNTVSGSGDRFCLFPKRIGQNRGVVDRRIRVLYFCFEIRLFSEIFQQEPVAFRMISLISRDF
jgi:hypothetical protein